MPICLDSHTAIGFSALAAMPEVQVVAEAATGSAAIREALLHRPDVVVMDLQMSDTNSSQVTWLTSLASAGPRPCAGAMPKTSRP
jgi:DNA-binding NarL/FixJ family response regulator